MGCKYGRDEDCPAKTQSGLMRLQLRLPNRLNVWCCPSKRDKRIGVYLDGAMLSAKTQELGYVYRRHSNTDEYTRITSFTDMWEWLENQENISQPSWEKKGTYNTMPEWKMTIDVSGVFHNENYSFTERRDIIVRTLRKSSWLKDRDEFDLLVQYVEELSTADNTEEFNSAWSSIYDEADADRVWIRTV